MTQSEDEADPPLHLDYATDSDLSDQSGGQSEEEEVRVVTATTEFPHKLQIKVQGRPPAPQAKHPAKLPAKHPAKHQETAPAAKHKQAKQQQQQQQLAKLQAESKMELTPALSGEDLRQWVDRNLAKGRQIAAEAVWDNPGLEPDGLQFKAGDAIIITATEEHNWWWGVRSMGREDEEAGRFPTAAVRVG